MGLRTGYDKTCSNLMTWSFESFSELTLFCHFIRKLEKSFIHSAYKRHWFLLVIHRNSPTCKIFPSIHFDNLGTLWKSKTFNWTFLPQDSKLTPKNNCKLSNNCKRVSFVIIWFGTIHFLHFHNVTMFIKRFGREILLDSKMLW